MDYGKLAEAALREAQKLSNEVRSVQEDATLTDADKRSRTEAMNADILAKQDEARSYIEQGEREVEVRGLMERAGALNVVPGEARGDSGPSLSDQLRSVASGDLKELRVTAPAGSELRTATVGAAANAGNTVPTTFVAELIQAMRNTSPLFGLSRVITTNSGEPMQWPRRNFAGANNGHVTGAATVAEGATYTKGDSSFDTFTLGSTKYGIIVELSRELVDDSELDIATLVAQDAGVEVGRKVATDAVASLITASPVGVAIPSGAAADPTADDLLTQYHSLVNPYRPQAHWLMNDATALKIRKFKNSGTGEYTWQPGLTSGQPDSLLTRPVHTDYNMPVSTAASTKATILFGDFSKFIIRQVNDIRIVRSDEYGFDRDVVAFKVSWRGAWGLSDGQSVSALTVTRP